MLIKIRMTEFLQGKDSVISLYENRTVVFS